MVKSPFKILLFVLTLFAWCVIMLGAYTRLTDAGLGCPDWPGCYGKMIVAAGTTEPIKAWTEMIHRYFAGTLGLCIGILAIASFFSMRLRLFRGLFTALALLVIFQAALGMWTVTWKLHPTVVMGHLLGGFLIVGLLWIAFLKSLLLPDIRLDSPWLSRFLLLIAACVFLQIALGGWTSANYAAMACTDFPQCREMWVPPLHFKAAFQFLHPIGDNYAGGIFPHEVKVTIQWMHRLGALLVFILVSSAAIFAFQIPALKKIASLVFLLLIVQIGLGISNILFLLPLPIAVLHNGVAALLWLSILSLYFCSRSKKMVTYA